jgi:hypothetical protein
MNRQKANSQMNKGDFEQFLSLKDMAYPARTKYVSLLFPMQS